MQEVLHANIALTADQVDEDVFMLRPVVANVVGRREDGAKADVMHEVFRELVLVHQRVKLVDNVDVHLLAFDSFLFLLLE